MREVVHRINTPRIASPVMVRMQNSVNHWVPQIQVGRGHVYLRSQNTSPLLELPLLHPREQVDILRHGPVTIRAGFSGLC